MAQASQLLCPLLPAVVDKLSTRITGWSHYKADRVWDIYVYGAVTQACIATAVSPSPRPDTQYGGTIHGPSGALGV